MGAHRTQDSTRELEYKQKVQRGQLWHPQGLKLLGSGRARGGKEPKT